MATWNKNVPQSLEFASNWPGEAQANNDALEDALNREHTFPGVYGDTAGNHKFGDVKWAVFTNQAVLNASYGVLSAVRTGVGLYTVTWSTPFANADYVVMINLPYTPNFSQMMNVITMSTGSVDIYISGLAPYDGGGVVAVDPSIIYILAIGAH